MSDYNRGAYTPPSHDAPLAFDARRPVRGGSPAPVTLIISAIVLVVLVAGAWFIYRDGFRGAGDAPKTVGTVTESKTAPKEADQPTDPADKLVIYNGEEGDAPPAYAPEPEQPLPRPEAPVIAKAPVTPVTPGGELKPAIPAGTPKIAPTPPPPAKVATAPVAPTPAPKATGGGSFLVQIGALSSPALADKAWNDAAALSPGAAAGKGKKVETVESGGKTLYRTSVTGFADRASAQAFCDKLKAAGKSCFVR